MLQERAKLLSKAGIKAEFFPASYLHQVEPALEVGKEGGAAFIPDDSQIDAKLAVSFIEENNKTFSSQGRYEEFFEDPVVCFLRSNRTGYVEGVQTANHVLYGTKAVIVAAGAWSCSLIGKLAEDFSFPLHVPVMPRKGHLLVLERSQPLQLNHGLMEIGYCNHQISSALLDDSSIDNIYSGCSELSVSMTATTDSHGNLVLGSSRQFAGFDCQMENAVVTSILERAAKFLPVLSELSLLQLTRDGHIRIGFRPYMPDGKPVIGPVAGLPKLMLATGHEGAGLCMAFGTAEMVVDMVLGNSTKVDPGPFSPVGRCCK
uniref:FAD-dependent oxidoreductase domain-containing protein 1 n=1 Tax=Araucaria cunninghamii TaxID=56994 RepID=A0A0D6R238_ARACU